MLVAARQVRGARAAERVGREKIALLRFSAAFRAKRVSAIAATGLISRLARRRTARVFATANTQTLLIRDRLRPRADGYPLRAMHRADVRPLECDETISEREASGRLSARAATPGDGSGGLSARFDRSFHDVKQAMKQPPSAMTAKAKLQRPPPGHRNASG